MMFGNVVDVILREAFNKPIAGIIELSELAVVMITFLGLAYTQLQRGHVRVEVLLSRFSDRTQSRMNIIDLLLALAFFALLTYVSGQLAMKSVLIREIRYGLIPFPIWPAKIMVPVGTFLLCLQLGVHLFREVELYRSRKRKV